MGWRLVLVHAQSISDVRNIIWISESGRVQVVVTELGGAARALGVSLRVVTSRNGYIWSRGEDRLEQMTVLWVEGLGVLCAAHVCAMDGLARAYVGLDGAGASGLGPSG